MWAGGWILTGSCYCGACPLCYPPCVLSICSSPCIYSISVLPPSPSCPFLSARQPPLLLRLLTSCLPAASSAFSLASLFNLLLFLRYGRSVWMPLCVPVYRVPCPCLVLLAPQQLRALFVLAVHAGVAHFLMPIATPACKAPPTPSPLLNITCTTVLVLSLQFCNM